ncbi:hypothetical protein D3C84_784550 [compost metagenome]
MPAFPAQAQLATPLDGGLELLGQLVILLPHGLHQDLDLAPQQHIKTDPKGNHPQGQEKERHAQPGHVGEPRQQQQAVVQGNRQLLERRGDGGHVLGQRVVDTRAAQPLDAFERCAQHLAHQPQAQLVNQAMPDLHQQPLRRDTADEQ